MSQEGMQAIRDTGTEVIMALYELVNSLTAAMIEVGLDRPDDYSSRLDQVEGLLRSYYIAQTHFMGTEISQGLKDMLSPEALPPPPTSTR